MTNRSLLLVLAFAGIAAAAPVEKVFYEWLSPDLTTVLCSTLIPGSCDPYDGGAEGEERFLSSHTDSEVSPHSLRVDTQIFSEFHWSIEESEGRRLRLRYSFEVEWDLGTYAYTGGTGDFLAEYFGQCGRDNYLNQPWFSFSVSSPFPIDDLCATGVHGITHRLETFGEPFQQKGHYRVFFDKIDPVQDAGPFPGVYMNCCNLGYDPDTGELLPFAPQIVPVTIPEPAGFTIAGFAAILSAVAARHARRSSVLVTRKRGC